MDKKTVNQQHSNISSTEEIVTADITKIRQWIATLPQGDSNEVLNKLLTFIEKINQQNLDIISHEQILNLFSDTIDKTLNTLKKNYHLDALPLSSKNLVAFSNTQRFLQLLCASYKKLINNIVPQLATSDEKGMKLLGMTIFQTFHYSSLLLIEQYLVYMKPEPGFWKEIHQLYQLAVKYGLHQVPLTSLTDINNKTHISSSYKRLLVIANADPFHLMQVEVLKTFNLLEKWGLYAKFMDEDTFKTKGGLKIEPETDSPSFKLVDNSNTLSDKQNTLYLDISDIVKVVRIQMQKLTLALITADDLVTSKTTFSERSSLSMYSRLNKVWGKAYKRNSPREVLNENFLSAIGLSTCHILASDYIDFTPEQDEIYLKKNTLGGSLHLTLVPKEHTPWIAKELENDIRTGVVKPRESHFEKEDIWNKKRATEHARNAEKLNNQKKIDIFECLVVNRNTDRGLSLYCKKNSGVHARVGELISFKNINDNSQVWNIGIIKWLVNLADSSINLGVEFLHGDVNPIAIKAVSGIGEGSEYFRALLINNSKSTPVKTIITPSAVYDSQTILLINFKNKLRYIKLKELISSSAYYSQFSFELTTDPELSKADNRWV